MTIVNVHDAKTRLSKLLAEVEEGNSIVIARNGKPVAELVPYRPKAQSRPGLWQGRVHIAAGFDDEDDGIAALFVGEEA